MKILVPENFSDEHIERINSTTAGVQVERFNVIERGLAFSKKKSYKFILNGQEVRSTLSGVEVCIPPANFTQGKMAYLIEQLPDLKWLHSIRTGPDVLIVDELKSRGIKITNHHLCSKAMAEFVLAMILSVTKNLAKHYQLQKRGEWKFVPSDMISTKRVGILGLGHLGRSIANCLKRNGMEVWGWNRSEPKDSTVVDKYFPPESLKEVLKGCDFIVIALPLTEETKNLINTKTLELVNKKAWLINMARAEIIEGGALLKSLNEKKIAGVVLDLVDQELKDKLFALGQLENVILTHYSSFYYPEYNKDIMDAFLKELKRYLNRSDFENIVSIEKGY